jgi:bifunctional pyridoxal-dependent enzyme with beta-cystathionase and maltose regulon repressor activities
MPENDPDLKKKKHNYMIKQDWIFYSIKIIQGIQHLILIS